MKFVDNYFKTPRGFVFFDSLCVVDTGKAFARARQLANGNLSKISLYKLPYAAGTWDRLQLVGHRTKSEIEADLIAAFEEGGQAMVDEEDRLLSEVLHEERKALENAYREANRFGSPLAVVAA